MQAPIRLQRKRTKGFKLASPNGLPVVYVGRPTKWSNPYIATKDGRVLTAHGDSEHFDKNDARIAALDAFKDYARERLQSEPDWLDELKGKNLACWCPLKDKDGTPVPCHADILLKLANKQDVKTRANPPSQTNEEKNSRGDAIPWGRRLAAA